jgi:ankyrin repeat protein
VKLLVERGAPVSHAGWAPLHYAAFEGRAVVVSYLLDKGADKNALAPNGYTALMLAARGGHTEAAKMLLYEDVDVSIAAPGGETAMSITKNRKDPELEELLKRAGAAN